jgi:hypothetical protein
MASSSEKVRPSYACVSIISICKHLVACERSAPDAILAGRMKARFPVRDYGARVRRLEIPGLICTEIRRPARLSIPEHARRALLSFLFGE